MPKDQGTGGDVGQRIPILRAIEQIEALGAQIKRQLFAQCDAALEGGIDLPESGPAEVIASEISPGPGGGSGEGRYVDPLLWR